MIRIVLLSVFLVGLVFYAWKDWYKSLCGLIVMMAVIEHPDMPKSLMGIHGLNPWNLTFAFILLAWLTSRGREGLKWDMPRGTLVLLLLYLGVIAVACYRLISTEGALAQAWEGGAQLGMGVGSAISELFINNAKWVLPGLLLYDGCRDRSRFVWGVASIMAVYVLLAVQVIKWMPLGQVASGGELTARSLKILVNEIGYHRVNMSMMLAGASWAILSTRILTKNPLHTVLIFGAAMAVIFGQALTGGRTGYATWAVVGMVLCVARWRKMLLLIPVVMVAIMLLLPSAVERMGQGFSEDTRDRRVLLEGEQIDFDAEGPDVYTVLAGRNVAWQFVIAKIVESPLIGYGRLGMQTTGLMVSLWTKYREAFPHPHNAYLEWLLDNGLAGFAIVMTFYIVVVTRSLSLFRSKESPYYTAIGGVSLSLVLALLIASFGSQSFYPREGSVGMWCAIGLMLRVYVDRRRTLAEGRLSAEEQGAGNRPADAPPAFANPWLVNA